MICSETEWYGRECEELTSFETESIAKDVHGEGIAKLSYEMRRSGEESVEVKGKRLA